MGLRHIAHRSSRSHPGFLGLLIVMASGLLASTTVAADEELAATGPQSAVHGLNKALGPDAARQIRHDATVAQAALAAELRAELQLTVKPSLDDREASVAGRDTLGSTGQADSVSANAEIAGGGGAVQSRAAIEHTRVFMLIRTQRSPQGVLVQ